MDVFVRRSPTDVAPIESANRIILDLFPAHAGANVTHNIESLFRTHPGHLNARDFLAFAVAVFVCDKVTPRKAQQDAWSRTFSLTFPVSDVGAWQAASESLQQALAFLTGDTWELNWTARAPDLDVLGADKPIHDAVALFSGGLDSLIGAIDFLESNHDARLLLIAHHDSNVTVPTQEHLADKLIAHYGSERVILQKVAARPASTRDNQLHPFSGDVERSTRSRSLLFIAAGTLAISELDNGSSLIISENGPISLNVALSASRFGSLSTRTTHPYYFHLLGMALEKLGLPAVLSNPYQYKTKGEMVCDSRNQPLLLTVARESISCSHPEVAHWLEATDARRQKFGATYGNCGYCYPCIIRRAAFNANSADNDELSGKYLFDVLSDLDLYASDIRRRDAIAVAELVRDETSSRVAVISTGPIPDGYNLDGLVDVFRRGKEEVRNFLNQGSSSEVKIRLGLLT